MGSEIIKSFSYSVVYCLVLCVLFDVVFSLSPCVHVKSYVFPEFCNVELARVHSPFSVYDLPKTDLCHHENMPM